MTDCLNRNRTLILIYSNFTDSYLKSIKKEMHKDFNQIVNAWKKIN